MIHFPRRVAWCVLASATLAACGRGGDDEHRSPTPDPLAAAVAAVIASAPADGDTGSQVQALAALGVAAVPALRTRLHDPAESVRLLVVQALGAIGGQDVAAPLLDALADESWQVRLEAVRALGTVRPARAVDPLLRLIDQDPEEQVRYEGLTTLGLIGSPTASPRIVAALRDDDPYMRMWAMDALCTMQDPDAPTRLPALIADPSLYVRRQVVRSCHAAARTDAARRALLAMTLDDPDFESAVVAREALAEDFRSQPPDSPARALIERTAAEALAGPDATRVRRAAFLLGNVGDPRALDALVAALADPAPLMRHHAAHLLGQIADDRAVGPLVAALHDGVPLVRATALGALKTHAARGNAQAKQALSGT